MKEWRILISRQAERDLREVYEYIALTLLEPSIASKLIYRIEDRITKLSAMPLSYSIYPKEPWKSRGLRRVNVGNYAIFFVPSKDKNEVIVIRVIYGGRDTERLLGDVLLSDMIDSDKPF